MVVVVLILAIIGLGIWGLGNYRELRVAQQEILRLGTELAGAEASLERLQADLEESQRALAEAEARLTEVRIETDSTARAPVVILDRSLAGK